MNIRFEVDKENLRLFLEDVPSKVRRNTLEMISDVTITGLAHAYAASPVDTGALRDNMGYDVVTSGENIVGTIYSNAIDGLPYNVWQEFGNTRFNVPYPAKHYMTATAQYLDEELQPNKVTSRVFKGV